MINPDHGTPLGWAEGTWTTPPVSLREDGTDLLVEAAAGSDAWRNTSYGFIHESEHALLADLPVGSAMEVSFRAEFAEQFDQAGLFLRVDTQTWIKAGVEWADGALQLGAVVTHGSSDWSVAPVPEWNGRVITIRLSREPAAVTVRSRVDDGPLRLVRVTHLPPNCAAQAGPYLCAPTRAGLSVRFLSWVRTAADAALH